MASVLRGRRHCPFLGYPTVKARLKFALPDHYIQPLFAAVGELGPRLSVMCGVRDAGEDEL